MQWTRAFKSSRASHCSKMGEMLEQGKRGGVGHVCFLSPSHQTRTSLGTLHTLTRLTLRLSFMVILFHFHFAVEDTEIQGVKCLASDRTAAVEPGSRASSGICSHTLSVRVLRQDR